MNRRTLITALCAAPLAAAPLAGRAATGRSELDVPFVTTPQRVVDAMLDLAGVGPDDTLLDLGSGDGRIVLTAARRWGTRGLGIEIDPRLVAIAEARAREAGLDDRARFAVQDLFETDLSKATVITLYLLPDVNMQLRPKLRQLAPGTRIVSHDWDMQDWQPDRDIEIDVPDKPVGLRKKSRLLLWVVR